MVHVMDIRLLSFDPRHSFTVPSPLLGIIRWIRRADSGLLVYPMFRLTLIEAREIIGVSLTADMLHLLYQIGSSGVLGPGCFPAMSACLMHMSTCVRRQYLNRGSDSFVCDALRIDPYSDLPSLMWRNEWAISYR